MDYQLYQVDEYVDIAENNEEAMNEAIRIGHSTYDLLYFTLARRYSGLLMTLDKELKEIIKGGNHVDDTICTMLYWKDKQPTKSCKTCLF